MWEIWNISNFSVLCRQIMVCAVRLTICSYGLFRPDILHHQMLNDLTGPEWEGHSLAPMNLQGCHTGPTRAPYGAVASEQWIRQRQELYNPTWALYVDVRDPGGTRTGVTCRSLMGCLRSLTRTHGLYVRMQTSSYDTVRTPYKDVHFFCFCCCCCRKQPLNSQGSACMS